MKREQQTKVQCQICGKQKLLYEAVPGELVRASIVEMIRKKHPNWSSEGFICLDDLNSFRSEYIREILAVEKGELSSLEKEVIESLKAQDLLSRNINKEFEGQLTLGERVADRVADFGGSWRFIIGFGCVFMVWIAINSVVLLWRPYDPYPFILLNLILSCLAAIQAPVIMMSQNRQEARDRLRSENDYRVNLKAELEIRHLSEKMDYLLTHQWQRLLEIQQIQMELIEDFTRRPQK